MTPSTNGANLENINPKLYKCIDERLITAEEENETIPDDFDSREIFGILWLWLASIEYNVLLFLTFLNIVLSDLIRSINDPEHPLTLEELNVVEERLVEVRELSSVNLIFLVHALVQIYKICRLISICSQVDNVKNFVNITYTPTIPHCSMATLIGLCIRVQLLRTLPSRYRIVDSSCFMLLVIFLESTQIYYSVLWSSLNSDSLGFAQVQSISQDFSWSSCIWRSCQQATGRQGEGCCCFGEQPFNKSHKWVFIS